MPRQHAQALVRQNKLTQIVNGPIRLAEMYVVAILEVVVHMVLHAAIVFTKEPTMKPFQNKTSLPLRTVWSLRLAILTGTTYPIAMFK